MLGIELKKYRDGYWITVTTKDESSASLRLESINGPITRNTFLKWAEENEYGKDIPIQTKKKN